MDLRELGAGDEAVLAGAAHLFDRPPSPSWTEKFLRAEGHHLLVALVGGSPVGFVTGVEMTHPDKGTEMFLYELGVQAGHRRRGIGTRLVLALGELARRRGCYGMWVATAPGNQAALATYDAAGAAARERSVVLTWEFASDVADTPGV